STRPALDRVVTRILAPFVLVDEGWGVALDIALAAGDVIAVTREGDRFGGPSPWRAGPPGVSAVTPAALADAVEQANEAELVSDSAAQSVELARQRLAAARRTELVATERDPRLAARPDEEARARARRAQLEHKRDTIDTIAIRLTERAGAAEELADRLRRRRREQSEAARAAGVKLDGLRAERGTAEQQLVELRERAGRLEIEEAEIRLRLEQAVENVRREFDCEPDVAIAAEMPEVP